VLAVGSDTIGDVQVLPEGVVPEQAPPRLNVDDLSKIRFSDLLAELGIRPERVALPGVQEKVSTAMLNLPVAQAGDRFILKLTPPEYPHLAENESFFLAAARTSGLAVADTRLVFDAEATPGLLMRRFDRVTVAGRPIALAVEDACQVAARPPADKYVIAADAALGGLAAVCDARPVAARALLLQLVFAYVSGNGDAHAKNFSVLQEPDGEWRVAPAYDMPSSQPYGDTTMAMPMRGRVSGDFGGSDFVELGIAIGLPPKAARRVIDGVVERADRWLGGLDELPFDAARIRKLRRVIDYRRQRLVH
jgi:serine/threonine-protein kinase HipA